MKKKLIAGLLACTLVAASLMGCGNTGEVQETSAEETTKENAETEEAAETETATEEEAASQEAGVDGQIAIITPSAEHGWLAGVTYYAELRCKELGLNYKTYQSDNVNAQANDIQDAIAAGSAAVVMFPHNDEVTVAAQEIIDAGIPLVVFDRKIDVDYNAYIAGNNEDMGVASAEYIGDLLGGKGTVAVENVPSSGSVSTERVDGFKSTMAEKYPDIVLVDFTAEGFAQEQGLKAASDLLVANPQLDAIYSLDDESSMGFIQAIKEAGRTDIKAISGGGGSQNYFKTIAETKDMTLFSATYSPIMMMDAVDLAVSLMKGESVDKDNIIPTTIVTSDNVEEFFDESSPY
ncbi:MAG: substrate-binding domain-containing protein [Clostridiales bacterium]|nr:substrate-binding domain-containing protein [Clostridiales bacterium]